MQRRLKVDSADVVVARRERHPVVGLLFRPGMRDMSQTLMAN